MLTEYQYENACGDGGHPPVLPLCVLAAEWSALIGVDSHPGASPVIVRPSFVAA
jgi:hypothetical protein